MCRNIRSLVLFAGVVAATVSSVRADEPAVADMPRTYAVWTGSCSRSLRELGRFSTAREACRTAAELRSKGNDRVYILSGRVDEIHWGTALEVFRHHQAGLAMPTCRACSVYSQACRNSWQPANLEFPDDVAGAEALVKQIRSQQGGAELVYHLAAK